MYKKKVNDLTICKDTYDSQEEFENAIKKAVMCLLENEYIMTVRYEEPSLGIVAIEYEADHPEYGSYYPYWLLLEEEETVMYEDEDEGDE